LTSLRARTRDTLLTAIRGGAFPDGRLPPEGALARRLGVSRTTIRGVLQGLAEDGVVSRRRRHGTTVNQHLLRSAMRLNRLVPFTTLVEQSGHAASTDAQHVRGGTADAEVAEALGIDEGAPCVIAERLLRAGGAPVIAVCDVVPVAHLTVDPADVADASTTFEFVERNAVAAADYASTAIVPRVATADAPAGLDLPDGTPYIELVETIFSAEHEPLAISRVAVDDRLVRLSLLRRDG
jgi:GntR family transcriptional regulator